MSGIRGQKGVATRERTEHRAFLTQYKDTSFDDNAGIFEGYVAVFNNLDQNGDIIERGAFSKTLSSAMETKARNNSPYLWPLLWQHNEKEPIGGILDAHEDDHGLFLRGQYDLDIPQGQRAYSGAKKGYLRGLSIGYDTIKSMYDAQKLRHLLEVRMWEGSPVTFPANTQAGITDVKNELGDKETKDGDAPTDSTDDKALAKMLPAELKDLTGLAALTQTASGLDNTADCSAGLVQTLAMACGMSLVAGEANSPHPTVAAMLAAVPGLEDAVKAVISSWQEFSTQTDALLQVLGLPDNDEYGYSPAYYMESLRSAFMESKQGRQFSQANLDALHKAMDGITGHVGEVKAMLKSAENPLGDEMAQGADYGDVVASGQHNNPGKKGTGREPELQATTPSTSPREPGADAATLAEIQSTLLQGNLLVMQHSVGVKE